MEININKSDLKQVFRIYEDYVSGLSGVIDDYWEDKILNANIYSIFADNMCCGCFSIFENEQEGRALTSFYLTPSYYGSSQTIFSRVIKEYEIKKIMVATCDELFLSLSMGVQKRVEPHAYFFDGTIIGKVRPAEYSREWFAPLQAEDLEEYRSLTESFFGEVTKELLATTPNYYFKLQNPSMDSQPLGYGYIGVLQIKKGYGACGMITVESERRHGVGRSIQMHLADFCREKGMIPVSGCWYYNHLSKMTIESAGRYTKTRYLDIYTE